MAPSMSSYVSEDEKYSILDLAMLLWIIPRWFEFKYGETLFRRCAYTHTHARTRARACGVVCVRVYDRARVVWCGVVWCGVCACV